MEDQKEEVLTPYTLADRNEILVKYANFSFKEALAEVKDELKIEKDFHRRLGLLAAQSWILRQKLYVALHDPYISALSEIEDTDIFDGLDDDDYNEYDSLFDEDTPEVKIEVLILKATTIDGKKITKDTIVEIEEKEANKLIDAASPLLPSEYFEVLRKKEAGRGETDKHNKFFNSSKLSSGKFTNAEAIGRCFENLIDPILINKKMSHLNIRQKHLIVV